MHSLHFFELSEITLEKAAASAVILATEENKNQPQYSGLNEAAAIPNSDFKLFGKPTTRKYRRMGVTLAYDNVGTSTDELRKRAKEVADKIKVS